MVKWKLMEGTSVPTEEKARERKRRFLPGNLREIQTSEGHTRGGRGQEGPKCEYVKPGIRSNSRTPPPGSPSKPLRP